jgi:hypothetical protein
MMNSAGHGVGARRSMEAAGSVARNNMRGSSNVAGKIELEHARYAAAQYRRDVQPRAAGVAWRGARHAEREPQDHSGGDADRRNDAGQCELVPARQGAARQRTEAYPAARGGAGGGDALTGLSIRW